MPIRWSQRRAEAVASDPVPVRVVSSRCSAGVSVTEVGDHGLRRAPTADECSLNTWSVAMVPGQVSAATKTHLLTYVEWGRSCRKCVGNHVLTHEFPSSRRNTVQELRVPQS